MEAMVGRMRRFCQHLGARGGYAQDYIGLGHQVGLDDGDLTRAIERMMRAGYLARGAKGSVVLTAYGSAWCDGLGGDL
jgi:hypothetical protein